jgi:hypothetical protein
LKKNKLKVGDRIRITKINYPLDVPVYGEVKDVHEKDPYFPYFVELDEYPNGYFNKFWLSSDVEWEVVGSSGVQIELPNQLELDFAALLGEDESPENTVYCNCLKPTIITNTANFVEFKVCTTCKKERA